MAFLYVCNMYVYAYVSLYDSFVPCRNGEVITSLLYVNWPLQTTEVCPDCFVCNFSPVLNVVVLVLEIFPRVCMKS